MFSQPISWLCTTETTKPNTTKTLIHQEHKITITLDKDYSEVSSFKTKKTLL